MEKNEITVRIKGSIEDLIKYLKKKDFILKNQFLIEDMYFIPNSLDVENTTIREILSKAIIVRKFIEEDQITKKITYKVKDFDEKGNILSQKSINCGILSIKEAKRLLEELDYYNIIKIIENDIIYERQGLELAIKDIKNGEKLIEIETNEKYDTIEKIKEQINVLDIPIVKDDYFVKKAEIELDKKINKK